MPADPLTTAKAALKEQLADLRDQQKRVEQALAALGGEAGRAAGRARGRARVVASEAGRGARQTARKTARRYRREGGTRADHALKIITDKPGVTVNEIAERLKVQPNYLYRVINGLVSDGAVKKQGRGYVAK